MTDRLPPPDDAQPDDEAGGGHGTGPSDPGQSEDRGGLIGALIRRRAAVLLGVFIIFVLGLQTYATMPREASPDVDVPVVLVTTPYPGVSPEDIETLLTIPIENELAGVKDLKEMTSASAEGASIITLEFEPEADIQEVLQLVRDRVDKAKPDLPEDAEDTEVAEVSFSDVPILIVTIGGPVDEQELKRLGEDLEDEVARIPGVLDAVLTGGRTREIRVQIDPHRLAHYELALDDVIGAIANENVNVPGGTVTAGDASFLLRVPGDFEDPREIEDVAVKRVGSRPVFVRDLGRVVDDFADRDSYARMNGEPAVSLAVSKRTGANILEVADAVKALARDHQARWPDGVRFEILGDQSRFVSDMVSELENGIITAFLLVIAVLVFFMGVRNALFVAISIPLSMLLAILIINVFGLTLNMMVLFSLIFALGMLVDNGIVLVENIYRHVEQGEGLVQASIDGTREVAGAVAASTFTTVAAFAPLIFWTGIMGQFMGYMPKTVVTVLMASLIVAVVILPVLTSFLMPRASKAGPRDPGADDEGADDDDVQPAAGAPSVPPVAQGSRAMGAYKRLLEWALDHRYVTVGVGVATLVGTFVAYGYLSHGTEFFPDTAPDRAFVQVTAPDGTDLEATDRIVRRIEGILAETPNVDFYVAETGIAGGGGGDPMDGAQAAKNKARVTVDFLPHPANAKPDDAIRTEDTRRTIDRIRAAVREIPGATITVDKETMGPPVGKPVSVEVSGDDYHRVGELAARLRRQIAEIEGVTGIEDDYRVGRPELRLRIDRGAATRVGASTNEVASAIRTAFAGADASSLRDGEDEYDIVVELTPEHREDLQSVLGLRIPGSDPEKLPTFPVPLSAVARYELAGGSGTVRHLDQKLVVTVSSDVEEGRNENEVQAAVGAFLEDAELPPGFAARLGGANDEQRDAEEFMSRAFVIAIFLIAMVLVTQFNSFLTPLVILLSVVMSLVGVLWGLVITGTAFGVIMTGLGVISLAGVVVNNAIVLLTYVEQLLDRGMGLRQALVTAGLTRFRPVMLTAATTVLGLVPMALGVSFDFFELRPIVGSSTSAFWGPMAIAVIFGLVFATVLTLVLVPTLYHIVDDGRGLARRIAARLPGRRRSGEAREAPAPTGGYRPSHHPPMPQDAE
jgi:multidrug efflux pump subunit AcrB